MDNKIQSNAANNKVLEDIRDMKLWKLHTNLSEQYLPILPVSCGSASVKDMIYNWLL